MAAPSGTVWGSIIGGYGRIGIYKSITYNSDNTTANVSVQVWFWSKYSVGDTGNTLYYDCQSASNSSATTNRGAVSIHTYVDTGAGWSTSNQVLLKTYDYSYTRGTSAITKYVYAKLAEIDRVGGTMYASTSFSVAKLTSYTVSYNANGGSGAPSSQTKWYGKNLTLSSTKPTRTGYTFQGWATSASGSVAYAAGASYTANAAVTLYAVWKAITYTVSYNANGGSGAPSSQTKTYGITLTLSSTKPTRTNYNFKGWGTSASSTTVAYAAGGSYTTNAKATLYAIWELAYVKPRIFNLSVDRCTSDGTLSDEGTCALVSFDWESDKTLTSCNIQYKLPSATTWSSVTASASGTSGTVKQNVSSVTFNTEQTYDIRVEVTDGGGTTYATTTLSSMMLAMDVLVGGKGISFGKTAELENTVDFAFDAKFNEPVYGNVMGLNKLPEIPANSDLNSYMETGSYAVYKNANAETIANMPVQRAGRLEVSSATGEGIRAEQWSYLRQRFIPYNSSNAVWERDITRNEANVWTYYNWWQSSLTPAASEKAYHEQKILWEGGMYMTETHTINLAEPVSKQPNGIVLVFSKYADGAVQENNFNSFFVPKIFVTTHKGYGNAFTMMDINFGQICHKYLYINDAYISGHANNDATGTGTSGITYANNKYVLRYVYGV